MAKTRVRLLDGNQIDIFNTNNTQVSVLKIDSNNNFLISTGTDSNNTTTVLQINLSTNIIQIGGISDANQFLQISTDGLIISSYTLPGMSSNLTLQNKTSGAGNGTSVLFELGEDSNNLYGGEIGIVQGKNWTSTLTTQDANLVINLANDAVATERLRINETGNLGLTNNTPREKIDLSYGNLRFNEIPKPTGTIITSVSLPGTLSGQYTYKTTYLTTAGETEATAASNTAVAALNTICISNIPIASAEKGVTARRLYRSLAGGAWQLASTLNDNTTTSFGDNNFIVTGSFEPRINTTAGFLMRSGFKCAYLPNSGGFAINTGFIPTNAQAGYFYLPTMSGAPSGTALTPNYIQSTPIVYDCLNNKLMAYNISDSTWRGIVLS